MLRRIIEINEEKCNGCGLCASACHEGAIGIVDGKAKLLHEHYCDGLGDCLPACPMNAICFVEREAAAYDEAAVRSASGKMPSRLRQWPVQIKLVPAKAPYFAGAELLIAADCTAYACGGFHEKFMKGKVTLIGCPKLDSVQYTEKLGMIFAQNDIRSITLTRMEVPCCGGMEFAIRTALEQSGKQIPFRTVVLSIEGEILEDR